MGDKIIRKMSEEETDRLLKEEFFEEADLIEKALFSDDLENSSENDRKETEEETEEAYQKLINKLKEGGIYREEDENVRESKIISDVFPEIKSEESAAGKITDIRANSGKVAELREFTGENTKSAVRSRRMHSIARAAAIGVVCVLGVFAASMTGEANRRYFINSVRYLAGDDTRMVIDNDSNELDSGDEYEARNKIEDVLGIKVPEFLYRPKHFKYKECDMDEFAGVADIQYIYDEYVLIFTMKIKNDERSSDNYSVLGNQDTQTIYVSADNIDVSVWSVVEDNDKETTCIAQWYKDDVMYQISGKIKKEILAEIVKNMKY